MKSASIKEIKAELEDKSEQELLEFCLRLIKFKKENKELLTYLLFDAGDENGYILNIKNQVDAYFDELNTKNLYIAKKNLRKILRYINRFAKYSGSKSTEATLLIYFCNKTNESGLNISKSAALSNLYASQIKKIKAAVATMHEDLQYDFSKEIDSLSR